MLENEELQRDINDILPQISFFGGTTKPELAEVMEYMYEMELAEGNFIYEEGDSPGDLYIILEGEVEFYMLGELIASSKRGQLFGMTATIGIQKQMVSAKTKSRVKLAVISRKFFMKMRKKNPELFTKIILNIARDLARDLKFMRKYVENQKHCGI